MLIDSNILVYSINRLSPHHKKAQIFLNNNIGDLQVAHQNIIEAFRALTHKKYSHPMDAKKAINAIEAIVKECEVIYPDRTTYSIAIQLITKYHLIADNVFDGYLAATALSHSIKIIATANEKDFRKIKEIKVINPFKQNELKN